jgi:hypothetical protein
VVHGVEGHHALDVRGRESEHLRHLTDSRLGYPAAFLLNHPKRREKTGLLGGIEAEELFQLDQPLAPEDPLVGGGFGPVPAVCRAML